MTYCKKTLTNLVLVFILCFSLIACGVESENESMPSANESQAEASVASSEGESVVSDVSEEESKPEFVKTDKMFEGETLTIFGKKDGLHTYSRLQWEYDSEIEGEAINDVVRDRNEWLKNNYGVTVEYISAPSDSEYFITQDVIKMISSDTYSYDIVCDGLTTMAGLALNKYLYCLNDLTPELDITKSWWDQGVNKELSIAGKNYYLAGDILITDDEYTYCLLYNKDLIRDNNISSQFGGRSVYDLVDDRDWTYDNMFTIAKQCAAKTSEGSSMTLDDTWGYIGDIGCLEVMMDAGGYRMAVKDDITDIPSLQVASESASSLFAKLIGYINDKSYCNFMERFGVSGYYGVGETMFASGRAAFYNVKLSALTTLTHNTETTAVIGVLPMPLADSNQEQYYNSAAYLHFSCVAVPVSVDTDRLDMIGACMEALGYLGQQNLTAAYIETTLKSKRADDDLDSDMIELILNSRSFDLASIYNWGNLNSFFSKFAGTSNTAFASEWDSIDEKALSDMQKTIDAFQGKQH